MKQKSLLTRLVLLLVMIAGAGTAWAADVTYVFTSKNWNATVGNNEANWTSGKDGGGFSNNGIQVTTTYSGANGTSPISFTDVTKIVATYNTNKSAGAGSIVAQIGSNTATTNNVSYSGSSDGRTANFTTEFTYTTPQSGNVKLTVNTTTNSIYLVSVTITTAGGGTPSTPSITANNVDIAYDATDGSIEYSLANATGNVTASVTTGDWLTLGTITASEVPFTCSANTAATPRSATVTLSYTGATDKVVTVTQAAAPNNISDITAASTAYTVVGTVVATNSRGFVIGDGTGYVYTYLNAAPTKSIGDKVKIVGTTSTYGHIIQFPNTATITESATSNYNGTPAVKVADGTALAAYNADYQLSDYLQFEGTLSTTVDGKITYYDIPVGSVTARISYPTDAQSSTLASLVSKNVRVKGYFAGTSTKNDVTYYTIMLESVEEVTTPTISINPTTAATFTYEEGNGPSVDQMFTITGTNLTSTTITASVTGDFEITDNETYGSSLTLASGDIIAVRLKAGLAKGDYSGTLTLSTTGATDVTVSLSGSVTGTTYTISIDDDVTGGTIEADKASAAEGATVTLTAKPDDAYTFGTWTVYKEDMTTTITVTDNQFTMPNCEVYVTATFTAKPTYKVTCAFNDAKGLLTATPEAAYEGQSVKLEYTTEDGYTFSSIVITKTADGSATNIIPTASGNDYTFTMPGYAVTATATFVSNTFEGSFAKVTSTAALEDGGYYILYSTKAMNSTVTSGKMGATEVTVNANNIIENPDRAIVWKLVKNGDNWDLYSEKEGKYCYIEGTNTSAFKMADAASYHYTVSVYDTGGFKFKTTHTSGRGINYGDNNFGSYADSNSPEVSLYKYMTLIPRNITFEGNGAKTVQENVNMYTQTVYDGVEATLEANRFAKENHEFAGWATNSDGTGTQYADKAKVTVTGDDLTLYAQWNPLYTLTIDNSIEGGTVSITGNLTSAIEGKEITLSFSPTVGHAFEAWNVYKEADATTKVTVTDNKFNMPAYNVVVSATFREATTYSLVTNANQIVSGKHYIIASGTDGSVKAMGEQKDNNRAAVNVTANDGVIPETTGVYEFVIFGPDADGHYVIYDETSEKEGYLYAASSSSNHLKTSTSLSNNGKWTITIDDEKRATIQAQGSSSRNLMRFNSTLFSCYASGQAPIYLFAKDNNGTIVKRTVHITAAGYATYCAENALEFTGSRMTAYIAKLDKDNKVTFEEVTCVPANTGVLLKGEEGDWNMNVVASSGTIVSSNKLVGVTEDTQVPAGSFVLMNGDSGVGFYKTTSEFTVRNHTAYMEALPTTARFIGLDNEATGIENINVNVNENGNWYNLNGQRVETPKRGLYIVNGKKIMVK